MDCYHIVFVSVATIEFSEDRLLELLEQARRLHSRFSITGMLAYSDGRFMQVLEGKKEAVQAVYANIAADLRHGRLEKLADGPIARCEFTGWHMGYATTPGRYPLLPNLLPLSRLPVAGQLRQVLHDFLAVSQQPVR